MAEVLTREECRIHEATIIRLTGGHFLKTEYAMVRAMNASSSCFVLSHLLNILRMKINNRHDRKRLRKNSYWIKCPAKSIERHLGMTHARRIRAIKSLSDEKLIQTDHRYGNILWVKINVEAIRNMLKKGKIDKLGKAQNVTAHEKAQNVTVEQHTTLSPYIEKKLIEETPKQCRSHARDGVSACAANGFFDHGTSKPNSLQSFAQDKARQFYEELLKKRKVMRKDFNLDKWSKRIALHLKELQQRDKIDDATVKQNFTQIMEDHLQHINEQYQPQCYAIPTFCDRYTKVEAAFSRRQQAISNGTALPVSTDKLPSRFVDNAKYFDKQLDKCNVDDRAAYEENEWATVFYALETVDKQPKELIEKVLQWSCRYLHPQVARDYQLPRMNHPKQFRKNFALLTRRYKTAAC